MFGRMLPLVAFAILLGTPDAGAQSPTPEATTTPCPVTPALTDVEGETVMCGTVSVPENYDEPDGAQIALTYAVLKSTSLSPAGDPVVYLHGGPGAAELRDLPDLSARLAPIRQTHDVIIFDQRGTGYSPGPLTCDVEYATLRDDVEQYVAEAVGDFGDKEHAVNRALFATCIELFADKGVDLTQYNTVNNARDVIEVVAALGYDDGFNLYGFSYGTQVALEVMRRHPEQLRSVILDSAAPASIKLYENLGQPNVEAITSLLAACADDNACNDAFPELQETFISLLERLDREPLAHADGAQITADVVVNALRQSEIRPGLGAYLPLMIWELDHGETTTLDAIRENKIPLPIEAAATGVQRFAGLELSGETQPLVDTARALQQQADELAELATVLMQRSEDQMILEKTESSAAGRFDLLVQEIVGPYPFDRRIALNEAYLAFPVLHEQSVAGLRAFVTANYAGDDARRLLFATESMSDEDVATLATIVFQKARTYATFFNVAFALHLYVCQDHVPYNTVDGALAAFEKSEVPQVARGKWRTAVNLLAMCDLFPAGNGTDDFHRPVTSRIPTLLLLGSADAQTATSWGIQAAETLENSQVLLFPETGHGTLRYSQCARDIGAAFLNRPDANLNTSCVEALRPKFVLPPNAPGSAP